MRRGSVVKIDSTLLRKILEARDLTQVGLADMIGMHTEGISRLIARGNCRLETLENIETALSLPKNTLLAQEDVGPLPEDNKPRYHRLKAKLSAKELAEKSGVSVHTISRLENGFDCYSFNAACLARALGLPMGVYLGYED